MIIGPLSEEIEVPEPRGFAHVFVDGGVVGHNPSLIGGTWATRVLRHEQRPHCWSGAISLEEMRSPSGNVTNNQTEMLALIRGLQLVISWEPLIVYSDSDVTLCRAFRGGSWNNIPSWMQDEFERETRRLEHWSTAQWHLLDGHPTATELVRGIGRRGHAVSPHNVWCDQECARQSKAFMKGS